MSRHESYHQSYRHESVDRSYSMDKHQYEPLPEGLVVHGARGKARVVFTDQEICDDVMATIPKLQAAVERDAYGRRWKPLRREDGVDLFELDPNSPGDEGNEDLDIVHALVGRAELKCHLNEVLSLFINKETPEYESTMSALCGDKFKAGNVLFSQSRALTERQRAQSIKGDGDDAQSTPQQGLIGVSLTTMRPKPRITMKNTHKRTQKLCFSSCTQVYPDQDRAVHVMKTLPKAVHDQVVAADDRSSLRRELDHLGVGFHVQSTHRPGGSINQTTRVFVHTYASTAPPASFGHMQKPGALNAAELARRREAIMNPEAKEVMAILTKSLRSFERVIRRRRFGFQSFVYFPKGYDDPALDKCCSICSKRFTFFRRDFFCQLCGHMVCKSCSDLHEVEARIGEIRKNRACGKCVVRVDACHFDDEELLAGLGPVVIDVDDAAWMNDDIYHLKLEDLDNDDTASLSSEQSSIEEGAHEQLYSEDPTERSLALDFLGQLVEPGVHAPEYEFVDPAVAVEARLKKKKHRKHKHKKKHDVRKNVEKHLTQSLRVADRVGAQMYEIADERDYEFEFASDSAPIPLPPMPEPRKEAHRLQLIDKAGVLEPTFDREALDLIAQVAAERLGCPIGFVSVVDDKNFHAIGTYQLPDIAKKLERDNNMCINTIYSEKAFVIKNPMRDMRFGNMPCVQELGVKFYAGFPVRAPDGSVVASLCAADAVAHENITTKDYATMDALSKLAGDLLFPPTKQ